VNVLLLVYLCSRTVIMLIMYLGGLTLWRTNMTSRASFLEWVVAGKPSCGYVHKTMCRTRAEFSWYCNIAKLQKNNWEQMLELHRAVALSNAETKIFETVILLVFYLWTSVLRRVIGLSGGLLILMCSILFLFFSFCYWCIFCSFLTQFYVLYILTMDFWLK